MSASVMIVSGCLAMCSFIAAGIYYILYVLKDILSDGGMLDFH